MLRDVSSRFKYSERDIIMRDVLPYENESPCRISHDVATSTSSNTAMTPSFSSTSSPTTKSSGPNPTSSSSSSPCPHPHRTIPSVLPPPTTSPSRALVHKSLRRYYHDLEVRHMSLDMVSDRMLEDLAPFAILKLGGFALGDLSAQLLAAVLRKATTLRTLDLGFNRISDDGAACLASALEHNTSLESLYLSGNDIGVDGANAFAVALTRNCTLKKLHLSGNDLGAGGAATLAQALMRNTGLRSLHLGTNRIGSRGTRALALALMENQRLRELTLGQNAIGNAGLQFLAQAFASGRVSLTTLELGTNEISADGVIALAKALCGAPNRLQNLYMENNAMGDVGASAFGAVVAKTSSLRVLDLSYSKMTVVGLRELCTGLCYNASLLCLQVDGHEWTSTTSSSSLNMTKPSSLNMSGMSLSSKSTNNAVFAASCVLGAVTSNRQSVLCKLSGVDLMLALDELPLSGADQAHLVAELAHVRPTRPLDFLARNDRILQFLHGIQGAVNTNKRKSVAGLDEAFADDSEAIPPRFQRQRTTDDDALRLPTVPDTGTSATAWPTAAPNSTTAATTNSATAAAALGAAHLRVSLPRIASLHRPNNWSASSPRYNALESHARKVLAEIATMPFDADEFDMLQTYYLGGCTSPKPGEDAAMTSESHGNGSVESLHAHSATDQNHYCPACQASRLARYRRTLVVKHRLEVMDHADVLLLVLLRRLHYLITIFRRAENADDRIDALLISMYSDH